MWKRPNCRNAIGIENQDYEFRKILSPHLVSRDYPYPIMREKIR